MEDDLFFCETTLDKNILIMYYISMSIYVFSTLFVAIFILYLIMSNVIYLLITLLFYKLVYYKSDYNKPYINHDDNCINVLLISLIIHAIYKKINL